ncbi:hypothetical protein RUND412_000127 [Rhizina undulata]
MSVKNSLYHQYRALIERWPVDPLRPTLNFQNFLRSRIDREFGRSVEHDATIPTQNTPGPATTGNAEEGGKPVIKFSETDAHRQLNALASLLENRYVKRYPVTDHLLKPKAKPDYYENLLRELEQAPNRSWLQRMLNSWKGWVRMQ